MLKIFFNSSICSPVLENCDKTFGKYQSIRNARGGFVLPVLCVNVTLLNHNELLKASLMIFLLNSQNS